MAADVQSVLVKLVGGGPYGFRLIEGTDLLVVDKVRDGGKAEGSGMKEGDRLLSINDKSCRGLGIEAVNQLIEKAGQDISLRFERHSAPSLTAVTSSGVTVKAPQGVHVEKNADESFTMTIGMPFDLDGALAGAQQRALNSGLQQQKADSAEAKKGSSGVPATTQRPVAQKILSGESSGAEQPSTPETPGSSTKKKTFMDSMFYDDPKHKYPTVEEQISLARQVAMSVLCPANLSSRGHKMFMKRKIHSAKWTKGATEEELAAAASNEVYEDPYPHAAPRTSGEIGGLPAQIVFAPKLPTVTDKERLDAMSMEEIERMELQQKKMTHTNVNPQLCFNLADDLKNMKGKGGQLFAKRQARVEKLEREAAGEGEGENEGGEKLHSNREEQMRKIGAKPRPLSEASGDILAPINRLKNMVEVPKAAMTPWDAAAEYGSVDKAFEHLADGSSKQATKRPVSKQFAETLEVSLSSAPRRNVVGRSGDPSIAQKSVSVDPERLKALGHDPNDLGRLYGQQSRPQPSISESSKPSDTTSGRSPHSSRPSAPQNSSVQT